MSTEIEHGAVSHQNVRLSHGRHSSPDDGACVVELASMLAGERFSDHPRSVCPVVASYMRTVNDRMPVAELRELYPFAAAIVGSRGSRQERRARARECGRWASQLDPHLAPTVWTAARFGWGGAEAATVCAGAALRRGGRDLALSLLEALLRDRSAEPGVATVESPHPPLRSFTPQ